MRSPKSPCGIFATLALVFAVALCHADGGVDCYISTGDNDWLWDSPPTQSRQAIEEVFASLRKNLGCNRVYWRGIQSDLIVENFLLRPENFLSYGFWRWQEYLGKTVGSSRIAVETAHQMGMDIWGFTGLFEHGAEAASDSAKGFGPSPIEDRYRIQHPEWIPVDRAGIRRQAGPIEFAYPEARKVLVRRYADAVVKGGYDGLMFYTYVEHCSITFEDEFGYNDPVVAEYKKRYGRDIRTEKFDKHAWYRLRGEYVTQFLRELRAELKPKGKKLGMAIDPQNLNNPAPWLGIRRDFTPTGRIHMDWQRWVREGIVDEIMVYCNGLQENALNDVLSVTQGTSCAVSAIHGIEFAPEHRHFEQAGVRRVISGANHEIECGSRAEQNAAALDGDHAFARMRVLEQIAKGKTVAALPAVLKAAGDSRILVRRQALLALASRTEPEALAAIEKALDDPEHPVRRMAAEALSRVNGPDSVRKLLAAVKTKGNFQFEMAVSSALSKMKAERTPDILEGLKDPDLRARRVAAYSLRIGETRPEALPLLPAVLADPDAFVRFCAASTLARFPSKTEAADALIKALDDPHPGVRSRAASALVTCLRGAAPEMAQRRDVAREKLVSIFALFGADSNAPDAGRAPDADWSYRPIGNALLAMGPKGKEALENFLRQKTDMRLADFAWHVLYVPQNGYIYSLVSEADAAKNYALHPRVSGNKAR